MTFRAVSIRSEADVLALVPFTLGFHPEDSLVLVALGPDNRPFHARIDLPDDVDELPLLPPPLVRAARRNGTERAVVVLYTDDHCMAEAAASLMVAALQTEGIACLLALRADGQRWYPQLAGPIDGRALEGVPYDVRSHELTSQSVLEGRVTLGSRRQLVDSLAPIDPVLVDDVAAAHASLPALVLTDRQLLAAEGRWLLEQLALWMTTSVAPSPAVTARVLRAGGAQQLRDRVWCEITAESADRHVELWRDVVRRSPEELVAPAAALLAFAAWLAGDGALGWCAVDRALSADPDHTLARLVGQALDNAVPPSTWRPPDPATFELHAG